MTAASDSLQNSTPNGDARPDGIARHPKKPHILVCASSATGHTMPMIKIADQLIRRGYQVTFLAIDQFRTDVESIGAAFRPVDTIDLEALMKSLYVEGWTRETLAIGFVTSFGLNPMAGQADSLYAALEEMRLPDHKNASESSDDIIILTETIFVGAMPLYYGAPLPRGFTKRPKIINIHAMSYMPASVDLPPFGLGLLRGNTPEERAAHQVLRGSLADGVFKEVIGRYRQEVVRLGGVDIEKTEAVFPSEILCVSSDICLQLSPPSVEYEISDLHPRVKMIGTLPANRRNAFAQPSFWDDVTAGDKKVIVVTQGTVEQNYSNLIVPTLQTLAGSSDLLVVAILGKKGATLGDLPIPDNARVIDYLSYDAILPYASAFVFNAGYGGFIHGVVNGVPMVFAGITEEKPEVASRGEYAGVGIDLKTGRPSGEQLQDAVNQLLKNPRYKKRVLEVKKENEGLKAMDTIEQTIQRFSEI